MTTTLVEAYLRAFFASQVGQMILSFLRVAAATTLACWVQAGMPIAELTGDALAVWLQLGVQAGVALVMANYFGPWERRYGRKKD